MPNGRSTRQTTPRLAHVFAVLIATLATAAGCQRLPRRYAEVVPEASAPATTRIESASADPKPASEPAPVPAATMPGLDAPAIEAPSTPEVADPTAPAAREPEPTPPVVPVPVHQVSSPTPLIDAALGLATATEENAATVSEPAKAAAPAGNEKPTLDPVKPIDDILSPPQLPSEAPAPTPEPSPIPDPEPLVLDTPPPAPPPIEAAPTPPTAPAPSSALPAPVEPVSRTPAMAPAPSSALPAPVEPVSSEPATLRDEWREGLSRLRVLSGQRAGEPGTAAQAWTIRTRVLDWLAGDGPEPAGQSGQVWNSVLATLSTATGPETPDEATLAYHLGAAVEALESYAPLQINALCFCRKIDGFGHYDSLDAPSVRPGQRLLLYCELAGLRYEADRDQFRARIASRVEILDANQGRVVWSETQGQGEDLCRRRRRDFYVNYGFVVPARLTPGAYSLRLSQSDLIANKTVTAEVPFTVKP